MIIEFSVENYRSISERQSISLVQDQTIKDSDEPVIKSHIDGIPNLLRAAVIYGANASGKSNFLRALFDMRQIILFGEKKLTYGDEIDLIQPFLLNKDGETQPTTFDLTFLVDGVRYNYGFSATSKRIIHEFLIAYPNNKKQVWFERHFDKTKKDEYSWKFSAYFKGEKETIRKSTLENVLFFSKAVKENNDQLKPLHLFIKNELHVMPVDGDVPDYTEELLKEEGGRDKVLGFLRAADLGIDNLLVASKVISDDDLNFPSDMPEEVKKQIRRDLLGQEHTVIKTIHHNPETGKAILFDLDQESVGTNKLFERAGLFIWALEKGATLFIDELETSLHCKLVGFLINLFNSSVTNPHGAQLIFTTHSPIALYENILRRDQFWFVDKRSNKTVIYPLKRAKANKGVVRKDENLVKAYLSGEYHAVPEINEQYNLF
jgi:hypothetical protein